MKKLSCIIGGLICISTCFSIHIETYTPILTAPQKATIQDSTQEPWVTIFIHGTLCIEKLLNMETLITLSRISIEGSRYQRLLYALRQEPYAYTAQAAQLPGLIPINIHKNPPTTSAELFAQLYKVMQEQYFPEEKTMEWLTFGWSGGMNHLERLMESKKLYKNLLQYLKEKKRQYPNLKLRLVTYSHGSNIALNLARLHLEKEEPLKINQLIMIATPVIAEMEDCIYSPIFSEIYSLYSRYDTASTLDIFSTRGFFPSRRFHKKRGEGFPPHFKQVELELKLTAKNYTKKPNNSNRTIEKSPGHLEMWLFGWPNLTIFCRRNFPLTPLPAALLAPAILAHLKKDPPPSADVVFCYKTDTGTAYTRKRFSQEKTHFQFIDPEFIGAMQSCAWNFWQNDMSPIEKNAINQKCQGILKTLLANR